MVTTNTVIMIKIVLTVFLFMCGGLLSAIGYFMSAVHLTVSKGLMF